MATTKQAEREQRQSLLADDYLNDRIYDALLERGEAGKISEITLEIGDGQITFPLVRRAVGDSPRFLTIDRMWDIGARYLDKSRPTERNLVEVMQGAGRPLNIIEMATELSTVYGRGAEVYLALLPQITRRKSAYFKADENSWGLTSWLPLVDAEELEDVLADNKLTEAHLKVLGERSKEANWSPNSYADATLKLVESANDRPVSHRVLGVLGWIALGEAYDARAHFAACYADERLVWLTGKRGGRWITRETAQMLLGILEVRGAQLATEDPTTSEEFVPPVLETPTEEAEGATAETEAVTAAPEPEAIPEPAPPLEVKESDLAALETVISERDGAVDVIELLALQYEIVAGDPSFRADVETLQTRLQNDARFLYVGAGRFREPNSLPLFVYDVPEFLDFPDLQFVSLDGEIMDEEIEDEGFVGTLKSETQNPLVQDAGDDENRYTGTQSADGDEPLRLVVKNHHKEIGTFPLCQVPDGFFPTDAPVTEVVVRGPSGQNHEIIINNEKRLAFNFFSLYEFLTADSGAVFLLYKGVRPYEFRFEVREENDAQVYLSPERIEELLALREQADEGGDMATFDIACEVLAHHPKGIDFVQYMTEVNIVRRTTRRKLASILSNYYCFVQKPGQPLWRFDAKKRDLGTDRAKRKYIKQR